MLVCKWQEPCGYRRKILEKTTEFQIEIFCVKDLNTREKVFVILVYTTIMRRNSSYRNELHAYQLDDYLNGFGDVTSWNYWMGLKDQYRILEQSVAVDLYITFDGISEILVNFQLLGSNEYSMNYSSHIDDKPCGKLANISTGLPLCILKETKGKSVTLNFLLLF